MKWSLKQLKNNLKNNHVISWFLIALTVLYIFVSIVFEFQDWSIIVYGLMVFPLLIGLHQILKEEVRKPKSFKISIYDGLFAFFGVIMTYLLSHQMQISAVIASSFIGLVGFLILKKYSVAIYCGSFAGMVSSFLFDYVEVVFIGLLCGMIYMLFKPVFKGMGGKLGTTAFLSTMLIASILSKDFLIIDQELSYIRLFIVSVTGTTTTFYFQHKLKQSAVLASASLSLVFALISIYLIDDYLPCSIVFFSASFVGMSNQSRLPHLTYVILAGIIHAFLYMIYFEHYNGLGGKLGLMALTTVIIVVGIQTIVHGIHQQFKRKETQQV